MLRLIREPIFGSRVFICTKNGMNLKDRRGYLVKSKNSIEEIMGVVKAYNLSLRGDDNGNRRNKRKTK